MKTKLFESIDEEKQMTLVIAAVVLHGMLSGPKSFTENSRDNARDMTNACFDTAAQFVSRAKELLK